MNQVRHQRHDTDLQGGAEETRDGPVMVIDTYLPRPGLRGAFLARLADEIHRTGRPAHGDGSGGSRVYRTLDGEAVVVVTEFGSHAEKLRWRGSEAFAAQLQRLRPLLEHALSRSCEPVAADDVPARASRRRPGLMATGDPLPAR